MWYAHPPGILVLIPPPLPRPPRKREKILKKYGSMTDFLISLDTNLEESDTNPLFDGDDEVRTANNLDSD